MSTSPSVEKTSEGLMVGREPAVWAALTKGTVESRTTRDMRIVLTHRQVAFVPWSEHLYLPPPGVSRVTCWGFQEIPERRGVSRATLEPLPCWTPCLIPCFQRHCPAQPQPLPASPSASAATLLLTFQLQDLAETARVRGTGVGPGLGPCTAHRDTATVFMKQSGFCSQASGLLPPWDNHSQNLSEQCTAEIQGLQGEPGKQDH